MKSEVPHAEHWLDHTAAPPDADGNLDDEEIDYDPNSN